MTVYCYDTEFLEDGKTIDLISIAIVCEDGREYYAVNSDADWDRIRKDDWLMDNVVRHLPAQAGVQVAEPDGFGEIYWTWGGLDHRNIRVKPKWVIANEVREFLLARPDDLGNGEWQPHPELWAYYSAYDHVALAQLWGKMIHLPDGIPMWTHDLMQLIETVPGFVKPEQDGVEHDALSDARWNLVVLQEIRRVCDGR